MNASNQPVYEIDRKSYQDAIDEIDDTLLDITKEVDLFNQLAKKTYEADFKQANNQLSLLKTKLDSINSLLSDMEFIIASGQIASDQKQEDAELQKILAPRQQQMALSRNKVIEADITLRLLLLLLSINKI
jgi:paraquat-inducible protein B